MLTHRRTIGAKVEATYGTAESIAATDLFYAYDLNFTPQVEEHKREPHKPSLSPLAPVDGRSRGSVSFKTELMGSAAAGTAPFWSALIQACGFAETIVASTSVGYLPATTGIKGATLKFYYDGVIAQLKGCRGTWSLECVAGQVPMISWTFEGLWDPRTDAAAWVDGALVAGSAYPAFKPVAFYGANITLDSYQGITERLTMAINNTLTPVPDANVAGGVYKRIDITGRAGNGEIDAEAVTKATKDFVNLLANKTEVALEAFAGVLEGGSGTGTLNTMTDSTKNWPTNKWSGLSASVRDSAGAVFAITGNAATTLTVSGTPATGLYEIYIPGQLIQVTAPKCVLTDVGDQDKNGIYNFGLPFGMYQNTGDDEVSIDLT